MTRRVRRIIFAVYAVALFIGTHIPNLHVRVPTIDRPDLLIHMAAFGGWFSLLLAAELLGPWRAFRSIALCLLIAICCAAVDEYSQSLPILRRTAAWDDFVANVMGIVLAAILALIAAQLFKPSQSAPRTTPAA